MEFLTGLFDTSDFPARWRCGHWTPAHGWLHILSDVAVWAAYFAIPLVLGYFAARRRDLPFRRVFLLFVAFILLCGTTHLMEAIIFWWPAYRLAGVLKLLTAVVSWVTVLALVRVAPAVLAMRTPEELEREVAARTDAERRLTEANAELERRVEERTADLGRAVVAVAEEKERLRTTLASIGDAVISTDRDGNVTYLNAMAESLTGWTNAEAAGVPLTTVFRIVNESTRLPVENPALRALQEGVIVGLANHTVLISKDGTERPIDDSAAPIRCRDGEIVGGVLVFHDITERHRAETLLAVQKTVLEMVATDAPLADVLSALAAAIEDHDRDLFCSVLLPDDDGQHVRVGAGPNLPAGYLASLDGQRIEPPYTGPCGMALHTGQAVVVADAAADERWATWREQMAGHGLRACRTTPVLAADGTVLGTFAVYSRRAGDPAPSDPNVLQIATRLAGIAIDRRKKEAGLRASEARFRELADAMPQIVYVTDAAGRIEFVNRQWLDYTGQPDAQAADLTPVVHPDDLAGLLRRWEQSAATATPLQNEFRLRRAADGEYRWFLTRSVPVRDAGGRVVQWYGTSTDIHDQKRAETAVRASEQFHRMLVEAVPGMVWSANTVDGLDYLSRRWEEYTGLTLGQIREAGWEAVHHPDEVADITARFADAALTGQAFEMEFRYLRHDGAYRWHLGRQVPVPDPDGRGLRWVGTLIDVDDRKRAENVLRQSEARFRAGIEAVSSIVWTNDAQGMMVGEQVGWAAFTGQDRESYQGYGWSRAVHPDDAQPTIAAWNEAVAGKKTFVFEHRVRRSDGQWRSCSIRAVPILDDRGEIGEWVGVHTDITEQKRAEEERERLVGQLREADRRKDEFLATLAHELRNPLAPIRNGLQVIRMAGANGTVEQARSMMERQLTQLVRLVDDLLDVSRVTSGKLELRTGRVELRAVIDAAVETSRPLIEQAGHELEVAVPDEPMFVEGDLTRLAQVVSNLLTNSAKYTHRGGHIRVSVERDGDAAVVSVRDDGIGIPPNMLDKVFEMFTQVDRTLEKTTGGLGIGLSLVKGLVEMHGGTIEARSEGEGRGSEFVVRLPVVTAGNGGADRNGPAEEVVPSPLRRILVVDDNADAADSLGQLLEMLGNEVRTAYDGEAGIRAAAEFRPAVVLCDIGMPKVNGYDAARRIRAEPWGQNMVLVALTGWGQEDDRQKSTAAGFDQHLVKPVETAALMKLLAGLPSATA